MSQVSSGDSSRQERLNRIVAEYLEADDAARAPDRQELLERYPDLAEELVAFFAGRDKMRDLAEKDAGVGQASVEDAADEPATLPPRKARPPGSASEEATLPPSSVEPAGAATLSPSNARVMSPNDTPPVGSKIRYFGDYELLEEIARGGMGVVYKAKQMSLNRVVALKMILAGQLAGEEDVTRFHTEAEAAANLDHPGIVPIFEVGEHEGQHYFSMGFVEGESLSGRVSDGPLPPREAAELTKKVAEAVAYAHEQGVIHRDLKPANVLLDKDGHPRVTDFGLAKKVEGDSNLTASGQILGTPGYMPPEQATGKTSEVGPASDVYSIGAILYELLTGRPPFTAATPLDTLMQVLETQPVPPRLLNPRVPRDLETVCMKCLEKSSLARYATARELADDVGRFLEDSPIQASSINLLDRVSRALVHDRHEEHFRGWGWALIWFGVVIFLAHVGMYGLASAGYGPLVALWIPRAGMFAVLLSLLWCFRSQSMLPTKSAERPVWAVWIGYVISSGAVTLVIRVRGHSPMELYALTAVLSGLAFFASGSLTWGGSYAIGIVFMVAAPLLAGFPETSVLWFGTLWGLALLAFGMHYQRLGRSGS